MNKLLIDCNIILDWILNREPFSLYASYLVTLAEENKIDAYLSPLVLANTHYIVKKATNNAIAEEFLQDCKRIFKMINMSGEMTLKAISNRYKDFEDDLHYYSAIENNMDYIITRNIDDFIKDKIKLMSAEMYLLENRFIG